MGAFLVGYRAAIGIERQKSWTTAERDLGRIPTLGPKRQIHGAPRTESGEGPSGPFQAIT